MMPRLVKSILFKITFLFSAATLAVLIAFGLIITKIIDHHFIEIDLETLRHKIDMLNDDLKYIDNNYDLTVQLKEIISRHEIPAVIFQAEDEILYAGESIKQNMHEIISQESGIARWRSGTGTYRGLRGRIKTAHRDMPGANIIVAMDITHHEHFMIFFRRILWTTIGTSIFCISILAWVATQFVLSPLRHIISNASRVSSEKLDIRLSMDNVPHELKELVTALNGMFARLEDSFQRLSDFSSDLSHELRTPVSNMKIQTQVALAQDRTVEEYREILQSNIEELNQISRLINDMLFLAKSENKLELPNNEVIDLEQEINSLFEFHDASAEDHKIRFELVGRAILSGDRMMLRRALSNLIGNAISHGFANTTVHVGLERLPSGHVRITVSSQGETIAPEHLPRLFERYYRVDGAGRRSSEGVGLGLAITRSIVEMHKGSIAASSAQGMTRFVITLPEA